MGRQVLTRADTEAAPYDVGLGALDVLTPDAIFAHYDGSSAASDFRPCVTYYTQDGKVFARAFPADAVAAGASADVSFFPGLSAPVTGPCPDPVTPVGTLFAWYDFADAATLTLDGAGAISRIADKSGNGHDALQVTASARPAVTTLNGLGAGGFDHTKNQALATADFVAQSVPITVCAVWLQSIAAHSGYWPGPYGGNRVAGQPELFINDANALLVAELGVGGITTAFAAPFTQQQTTVTYDDASSVLRVNGTPHAGTTGPGDMTNISLGAQHYPTKAGEDDFLNGTIGEVLYFVGALDASQLAGAEAYLKAKWATP